MKTLEMKEMARIEGGASACATVAIAFGVMIGSAFLGPAGIVSGLAAFGTLVNNAGDCEEEL